MLVPLPAREPAVGETGVEGRPARLDQRDVVALDAPLVGERGAGERGGERAERRRFPPGGVLAGPGERREQLAGAGQVAADEERAAEERPHRRASVSGPAAPPGC